MRQLTTIRIEEDWIITHAIFEGIGLFFQAFFGMIMGLLEAAWENFPVFLELKKELGYVSPEGVFAICAGVPLFLVSLVSWGLKIYNKHQRRYDNKTTERIVTGSITTD